MDYIRVPAVYEKLKKAESEYRHVCIMASAGWGKSAAVRHFFKYKNPVNLYVIDGKLTEMPNPHISRKSIYIIDDLQKLEDNESIGYIRDLLRCEGVWVILITRGMLPGYLADIEMDLDFVRITERDFYLQKEEIALYFESLGVYVSEDTLGKVCRESLGYPRAVYCYANRIEAGQNMSKELNESVWRDVFRYWDEVFLNRCEADFIDFVLAICPYKYFNDGLTKALIGRPVISRMIEYCRNVTGRLFHGPEMVEGEEYYFIGDKFREYLLWKRDLTWSEKKSRENYLKAAEWYEARKDTPNALRFYKMAQCEDKIKEILVKNVTDHPGTGHYFDTKEYYFSLPEEEIKKDPVLIAGMSMLCDLVMEPEKSEYWRNELVLFEKDTSNSKESRRVAKARIAYLNIGLPHKGVKGIITVMKNVITMVSNDGLNIPEMCATGNAASIMNGGLDFSEWSKNDTQIARIMGKPLEVLLGKFGKGLVTLALAESGFEKGTLSTYDVLLKCNNGYDEALHGGKIEMGFVAVGIMVRQNLVIGEYKSAKRVFNSFKEKAYAEKAVQLYPNLEAMEVWLSLFEGKNEGIDEFLSSVLGERTGFCITDRYRYMVKMRCLILEERYYEALELANLLGVYYEKYERYFMRIENEFLKSVILYRMEDEHWREHALLGIEYAREFNFVNIPALEGKALQPILQELSADDSAGLLGDDFFRKILSLNSGVSAAYPDYLKYVVKEKVDLTNREKQILGMLCDGETTEKICQVCGITYSGLKKHNRNIYKKLGVTGRAEAERKAQRLGLFQR